MTTNDAIDRQIHDCHFTHAGNAEALALLHGHIMRYVHGVGWHIWGVSHWKPDIDEQAKQLAKELARHRQKLIAGYEQDMKQKMAKMGMAVKMENTASILGCLNLAQSTPPFSCLPDDMDKELMVLACPNGTLYTEYGFLTHPDPTMMITRCADVPYDEKANAPRWKQFLREVFVHPDGSPDEELIKYIKKALGYSLTGDTRERCLFICIGEGANGKTTLFNIIKYILGSYAASIPFASLLERKGDAQSNDLAGLRGARFVTAVEAGQMKYLEEERVKELTGRDKIKCRFLYHEFFEYYPEFKLWMACNRKPRIRGTESAIWDRIKVIPFNNRFPPNGQDTDPEIDIKLQAEAPGILAWLVEGCKEWAEDGLTDCHTVKEASRQYRHEEDCFMLFLDENIEARPGSFVTVQEVWQRHNRWASMNGFEEIKNTVRMGREMAGKGYKAVRQHGQRGFKDIRFK
ncbi:hypothetical protein ES707_07412 [subsurface metagenome]